MVSRFQGSGRAIEGGLLATHKQDFNAHVTGGDYKHNADQILMNPQLPLFPSVTVQGTLEALSGFALINGTGFISIGNTDGYALGIYNVGAVEYPTLKSAIEAAIVDDRLQNGGVIFILPGTYIVGTTIEIPAGISIMGEPTGTIIIGEMTEESMFKFLAGVDYPTIGGSVGGSELNSSLDPTDESRLLNIILADNLNGVAASGAASMKTVPMVEIEPKSRVIFENVRFIGRVDNGVSYTRGKTLEAIGCVTPVSGAYGTFLTVRNCSFDGMLRGIDFAPSYGFRDYLIVDGCYARIFGEEGAFTSIEKNCFVLMSFCNFTGTDNRVIGYGGAPDQFVGAMFVVGHTIIGGSGTTVIVTGNVGTPSTGATEYVYYNNTISGVGTIYAVDNYFGSTYSSWRNVAPLSTCKPLPAGVITCGNGTTTFGDWNGASALTDAVTFLSANSIGDYRIYLKAGTYEANLLTFQNVNCTIEGESRDAVFIANMAQDSADNAISVRTSRVEFKNLTFTQGDVYCAEAISASSPTADGPYLSFDECNFINQRISVSYYYPDVSANAFGDNIFQMRNCYMIAEASAPWPVDDAFLFFNYTDVYATPNIESWILCEDCKFVREDEDQAAVRIRKGITGSAPQVRGARFNRCTFNLGSTATSGGNMTGNCGVLELTHNTSSSDVEIKDIEWKDCIVHANSSSSPGSNSILLFLDMYTATGGGLPIYKIQIVGGEWLCKANTELSPFYIGSTPFGGVSLPTEVEIRDVTLGHDNNVGYFSNVIPHAVISFPEAASYWAAYVVSGAGAVNLSNIKWIGQRLASDSGQLYVHKVRQLNVDGMISANYVNSGVGVPRYRFRFGMSNFSQYQDARVANVLVSSMLGNPGVASGGVFMLDAPLVTPRSTFKFERCHVAWTPNTLSPAFYLYPALPVASAENGHVLFDKCEVVNHGGDGFAWTANSTFAPLKNVTFSHCLFDACNIGASASFSAGGACNLHDITFDHCIFRDCASYAIQLAVGSGCWVDTENGAGFAHNIFDNNNGAASANQVILYTGTPSPVGEAYGNRASKDGSGRGIFYMQNIPSNNFRGTETSYSYEENGVNAVRNIIYTTGTAGAVANRRNHTINDEMLHNMMRWA